MDIIRILPFAEPSRALLSLPPLLRQPGAGAVRIPIPPREGKTQDGQSHGHQEHSEPGDEAQIEPRHLAAGCSLGAAGGREHPPAVNRRESLEARVHPVQPAHQVGVSAEDGDGPVGQPARHAVHLAKELEVQRAGLTAAQVGIALESLVPTLE